MATMYIPIVPSFTEDKSTPRESTDSSSHFYLIKNYIPKGGILVVRAGVTEFSFS